MEVHLTQNPYNFHAGRTRANSQCKKEQDAQAAKKYEKGRTAGQERKKKAKKAIGR